MNARMNEDRSILFAILFILVMYVLLPLSILIGIIPFEYKFHILTLGAGVIYLVLRLKKYKNADLGVTIKNAKTSILAVLPITIILVCAGLICWILGFSRFTPNEDWSFFVFYIFISSPVQEFLYRGSLPLLLENIRLSYRLQMIISSLLYSYVHIIYRDFFTLLLTFTIGLVWFYDYQKSKNLLGVSLSHAVLGVITIIIGVVD